METSTDTCKRDSAGCKAPAVSVVIPAYNTAAYIAEALNSIFAQTFTDFEVIVVNDGSPDTEELERVLRPYRERITYLKQDNQGPGAARNLGIRQARGEYIAFLDSDDWWLPEYLAEQIKLLEECPSVIMVCSDTLLFGDSPLAGKTFWQLHSPVVPVDFESLLCGDSALFTSFIVVRKQVLGEVGLFDENFIGPEDLDLWLRLAHSGGEIALQPKVLGRRRIHPGALTAADAHIQSERVKVLKKLDDTLELTPMTRSLLRHRLREGQAYIDLERGKRLLSLGNLGAARVSLTEAYVFFQTKKLRVVLLGLRLAPRFTAVAAKFWERCQIGAERAAIAGAEGLRRRSI